MTDEEASPVTIEMVDEATAMDDEWSKDRSEREQKRRMQATADAVEEENAAAETASQNALALVLNDEVLEGEVIDE